MTRSMLARLTALAGAAALSACSAVAIKEPAYEAVAQMRTGPEAKPFRTITGFAESLRCMDHLFIAYGVRELPILVEELADATKKVNAGTRDMLISAVAEMSKRSRAVRLITFGPDVSNLANFLANAETKEAYQALPVFDIRGSISQLDEGVYKKQIEAGVTISSVGIGAAKTGDASILALDLSIINARDYTVVPGVVARNSALIYKQGAGADGDAEYKKFGINFGLTVSRNEGRAQALRTLVELAAIELMGKLTKVPYWICLGADPESDEVVREIHDWHYSMSVNDELVGYMQKQLRLRGAYAGEIDGETSEEFEQALIGYRKRLGLSDEAVIDEDLLRTYWRMHHRQVAMLAPRATKTAAQAPANAPAAATAQAAKAPPVMAIEVRAPQKTFAAGEPILLSVSTTREAFVYCFLEDEDRKIRRFFPNRFVSDPRVAAGKPLALPGAMPFALQMNDRGEAETVACFATQRDVLAQLPRNAAGADFDALAVRSLADIRGAFAAVTQNQFAEGVFHVHAR